MNGCRPQHLLDARPVQFGADSDGSIGYPRPAPHASLAPNEGEGREGLARRSRALPGAG
jgi:hypothetical protein